MAAAEHEGLHSLFVLDHGNSLYGPPQAVLTDEGRAAFAAYAGAAAARYGGRGHAWEIWNEPNLRQFWSARGVRPDPAQYARLVVSVVPALRRGDPAGKILIGSAFMGLPNFVSVLGGVTGLEFFQRLFATGAQARVDGVTAHFYRGEAPETVAVEVAPILEHMAAAGPVLPLWNGEWGYSTYDPDAPATGRSICTATSPCGEDEGGMKAHSPDGRSCRSHPCGLKG